MPACAAPSVVYTTLTTSPGQKVLEARGEVEMKLNPPFGSLILKLTSEISKNI